STLKVFTTATALEVLGPTFRFETKLGYSGEIVDGVLKGDLYLIGGGDPCLGSYRFGNYYTKPNFLDVLVGFVKSKGISRIDGNIVGDASLFGKHTTPRDWSWEDIGNYWGAIPCALSIYDNSYTLFFDSPKDANARTNLVRVSPPMPLLNFENRVLSSDSQRDNAYIFGSQFDDKRWLDGTIPKNRRNFPVRGSIGNPALFAAQELHDRLVAAGIKQIGRVNDNYDFALPSDMEFLGSIFSPTLSEIVMQTNMRSVNLYAENLLRQVGLKQKNRPSIWGGLEAVEEFWKAKGMDTRGLFLQDGSGLSMTDGVTARQMVFVLRYMQKDSPAKFHFVYSLPIMGQSGTLSNTGRGSSAAGRVRSKTGTLSRTKSFAGYIECKSGRQLAFFAAVNNFTLSEAEIKNRLVELLSAIVLEY
ncbi:MAG: D-alanyl-D-alanine carboxypeptidase/D-alanyl-D-alanine-endopeptidase, partial [Bacteroidota bacterium]